MTPDKINKRQLTIATLDMDQTIAFCQQNGLIAQSKICQKCNRLMHLKSRNNRDGKIWRCSWHLCKSEISIRNGTFFENSKLSLGQVIDFIYEWAYESATIKRTRHECEIEHDQTICDWRMFLREICAEYFIQNPLVIGGPGIVVEIDESSFVRRKHNVGRTVKTQWVFGGYEVGTKRGFLVEVPNRLSDTLVPIIQRFVAPGTTIISDCWRSYNCLAEKGYNHLTVNHSINFVDPSTGATTNHVERMWKEAKQRNKRENGTHRHMLGSYLVEFMWRQQFGENPFRNIIDQIAHLYPVNE